MIKMSVCSFGYEERVVLGTTDVLVLAIARRAISIVERLQHLRTQGITAIINVESRAVVKLRLVGWHFAGIPGEGFRTDAGQSLVVCVLAAGNELETEVDVLLFFEDKATKNKISPIEAGQVTGFEDQCSVVECSQVSEVWAGGRVGGEVVDCAVGCEDPSISVC